MSLLGRIWKDHPPTPAHTPRDDRADRKIRAVAEQAEWLRNYVEENLSREPDEIDLLIEEHSRSRRKTLDNILKPEKET